MAPKIGSGTGTPSGVSSGTSSAARKARVIQPHPVIPQKKAASTKLSGRWDTGTRSDNFVEVSIMKNLIPTVWVARP